MAKLEVIAGETAEIAYSNFWEIMKTIRGDGLKYFIAFIGNCSENESKESWCLDCNLTVQQYWKFVESYNKEGIRFYEVHVGSREEWKGEKNPFKREEPRLIAIPTYIFRCGGVEKSRLWEPEIRDLEKFLEEYTTN